MNRKFIAIMMALVLAVTLGACGGGEETTLSGMVVSVDGTVVSLMEMDTENMGGMDFAEGERPEMPEGMEGFQGFGDFNPEDLEGAFPDGENFPQWGEGEMPEMPEGMPPPEGMTMPEDGEMPDFGGGMPNFGGSFENFASDAETKELDLGNAHISVEIDGGKESGTLENIAPGSLVTVTINGKGEATYVLVSAQSFFGGGYPSK